MKQSFEKILLPLNSFWEGMDKSKRVRFIIITSLIFLAIIISIILLGREEYVVLYNNMDPAEAGEVLTALEEMNVTAKPEGSGTILVPKSSADAVRMQLSAEGYPKSALNYDLFQNGMSFGATDFEKQKYLQFQLQERLQSSIKTLEPVEDAIVTLNIPDNSSFVLKEDRQTASASVVLKLKSRSGLNADQIRGITGLVSNSVAGLDEERVLIIDGMGNSLKAGTNSQAELAGAQLELEESMGKRLKEQVVALLEPVFGAGRVSAGVRVSLDFDAQTTESWRFDPADGESDGIAVSESTASETLTNRQRGGNVGQDANGGAPAYAQSGSGDGEYLKENRTVNYEVNQMRESIKKAQGQIKDISVSVLLDDRGLMSGYNQKVKDIVAGALGLDEEKVVVEAMTFGALDEIDRIFDNARETSEVLRRQALLRNAIILGALGLVFLITLITLLVRARRKKRKEETAVGAVFDEMVADEGTEVDFSANKSDKRKVIERSVEKNPELVAQLLRNWLKDDLR